MALRAGRLDEAWEAFSAALAAGDEPAQAAARNKRALVHLARGDRDAARAELNAALAVHAACVPALVNLGNLQLDDGDVDGAICRFDAALELDPDSAAAHHNLGVAYRRLGRHADAVRELRRATALELRRR
jgi:tetratricopeptide (TPR) repeat protein